MNATEKALKQPVIISDDGWPNYCMSFLAFGKLFFFTFWQFGVNKDFISATDKVVLCFLCT